LPGYSPREVVFIALLAQYHRKGTPKPGELAQLFDEEDGRALPTLAGMVRLAEFLERSRRQVVRAVRCHVDQPNGWVQIEALAEGDARMELWDASRNLDVLQRALGLQAELVGGVWMGT